MENLHDNDCGGGCNSELDCQNRFRKTPYFMSSKSYPKEIKTKTIMAAKEFEDYNKVYNLFSFPS